VARCAVTVALLVVGLAACAAPAPSSGPFPVELDGLPVLTVTQGLAARDSGRAGPHAIGGWFSMESVPHSCPATLVAVSPLEEFCHPEHWGLAELPEPVIEQRVTRNGDTTSTELKVGIASGPWIQPVLEFQEPIFPAGVTDTTLPVAVVLIGHFDDHRAADCPMDQVEACRRRFVATSVGWTAAD
jgi:hypothetical protein